MEKSHYISAKIAELDATGKAIIKLFGAADYIRQLWKEEYDRGETKHLYGLRRVDGFQYETFIIQ